MTSVRIQRQRTRGWRMPPNTVYVGRPTKWGNPWFARQHAQSGHWFLDGLGVDDVMQRPCGNKEGALLIAVRLYRDHMKLRDVSELRGKNLACWCPLDSPCHADVLLEMANRVTP